MKYVNKTWDAGQLQQEVCVWSILACATSGASQQIGLLTRPDTAFVAEQALGHG